jgi:two-component system sensor histidine kinase HydH
VELSFGDTALGMPEELRDRVFEPFFTYGKREGAAPGLSIARPIVEEHGGELWIESGAEGGSTLVLSLPL